MKITIITPNYNYANYIGKAIESVVNQDYKNIEHIIVDDGSTDNSVEIIKSYIEKYPNKIKLICQKNKGQSNALNNALKEVTGDIICWLNSDDTFCPNIFKKIIQLFEQNPSVFAIFGNINIIDKNDKFIRTNKYLRFKYISAVFNGFGKEIPSNGIFWKSIQNNFNICFDEEFDYSMDAEFWSRLLINKKVKKINFVLANFRWHEKAKTIQSKNKTNFGYIKAVEEEYIIMKKSYEKLNISKIIPFNYSKIFYYYYRLRRIFFRGLKGEYFKRNKL